MADQQPCIFCEPAPEHLRTGLGDERWEARWDGHPLTRGHALIVPREHFVSLWEIKALALAGAFELMLYLRDRIDNAYRPDGYNVGINEGPAAGRTVHHLHIHLIPRYRGDVADPRGGIRNLMPSPHPSNLWSKRGEAMREADRWQN